MSILTTITLSPARRVALLLLLALTFALSMSLAVSGAPTASAAPNPYVDTREPHRSGFLRECGPSACGLTSNSYKVSAGAGFCSRYWTEKYVNKRSNAMAWSIARGAYVSGLGGRTVWADNLGRSAHFHFCPAF